MGTLLLGIAALIALWGTNSVLDKVLEVQKQAQDIKTAVTTLQQQSMSLANAIKLLQEQIKEMTTARAFEMSPVLKSPNASKEEIEHALEESLPSRAIENKPTILLPLDRREAIINQLYEAKSPQQRSVILRNSLEYAPASNGSQNPKINPFEEHK